MMHGSSFKVKHFGRSATSAKELNSTINPNIILYYIETLNIRKNCLFPDIS